MRIVIHIDVDGGFTRSALRLESVDQEPPHTDVSRKRLQTSCFWCQAKPEPQTMGLGEKEVDCCSVVQRPVFR